MLTCSIPSSPHFVSHLVHALLSTTAILSYCHFSLHPPATSQLSQIKSTSAKVDEFDMLASERSRSDAKSKELEVDLLQGQNTKPTDFDEIEEWLKSEKNANEAEESLTSKEFEKFLASRAAVADGLPNISSNSSEAAKAKKKGGEEASSLLG